MTTIDVEVPSFQGRSYQVRIEPGCLDRLADACAAAPAHRYAVIADSRVAELYGRRALDALAAADLPAELFAFPSGEWNKSRVQWAELSDQLLRAGFGRDGAVIALGGGVTGDLAGFVASTYMRGVRVIQVPTTLLAMVDSSVGGKTGVDAGPVKNAIGAFHHPAAVLVDPELLATLSPYQRVSGLAEAVKAASIRDAEFFDWIERQAARLRSGDLEATTQMIGRSVGIKAEVVGEDPEERGLRAVLNFGHTFGHALESGSDFAILHGEAVAAGMRMEARLGESLRVTESGVGLRLDELLAACGLPEVLEPSIDLDGLLERARPDKKAKAGALHWVLLERPGTVARAADGGYTHAVPVAECKKQLQAALRSAFEAADSTAQ